MLTKNLSFLSKTMLIFLLRLFLLRLQQLPAEVAAEARRICHRSSRFCAAIEAFLYDLQKRMILKRL